MLDGRGADVPQPEPGMLRTMEPVTVEDTING